MKVKDIMIKEVKSLKPDDAVKDALAILFKMRISGLPVIDAKGRLAGMFTEKEVLTKILPSYVDKVGKFVYEKNPKALKQKIEALFGLKVSDVMRSDVVTVSEDAAVYEVAHLMLTQKARRIPVLAASGAAVVGIISREDILKALFEEPR